MKSLMALWLLTLFTPAQQPQSSASFEEFTGQYVGLGKADIDEADIYLNKGQLRASAAGMTVELNPTGIADQFIVKRYEAQLRFHRDAYGRVVRLHVVCADMDLNFQMRKK